jgi:hypothetical protein
MQEHRCEKSFYLKIIFDAVVLAGIIILSIGLYYSIIKAGIPFQDPPLELQIQYAVNQGIGDELTKTGFAVLIAGLLGRVIVGVFLRNKQKLVS